MAPDPRHNLNRPHQRGRRGAARAGGGGVAADGGEGTAEHVGLAKAFAPTAAHDRRSVMGGRQQKPL